MMIQTINFSKFCDGFTGSYSEHFSYQAKKLLFEHFEGIEESSSEPIEFDPISICCDYTEQNYEEIAKNYATALADFLGDCCAYDKEDIVEFLEENTTYIGESVGDKLVYANF